MNREDLLEMLLRSYRQSFDVERFFEVQGMIYDAYGAFNVTSAKYVLSKKAELWRAQCYEHAFFRSLETLTQEDLDHFKKQIIDFIEPHMVRHGAKCPPPNHMYTFLTGIFICENGVSRELEKAIRKFKYMKNYRFTIRGYCDARLVVFDLQNRRIYGNPAARDIVKGYKKIF